MWDETNFLLKGFINEVKGSLTESGSSAGGGENLDAELAAQNELIEQMSTAIEAKRGSGGGTSERGDIK